MKAYERPLRSTWEVACDGALYMLALYCVVATGYALVHAMLRVTCP